MLAEKLGNERMDASALSGSCLGKGVNDLGSPGGELPFGHRGERSQRRENGIAPAAAESSLAFPEQDRGSHPLGNQLVGPGPFVQLRAAGIEFKIVGGPEIAGETLMQVLLDRAATSRQEVVSLFPRSWPALPCGSRPPGPGCHRGGRAGQLGRLNRAGKDAVERVIVFAGNRVELVLVAPRTADRETKQATADQVDPVVDDLVLIVEKPAPDGEKAHRCQRSGVGTQLKLVGGYLLNHELFERDVGIKCPDHVISVSISKWVFSLVGEDVALGIGVVRHIEPVPAPALAIEGRGEKSFHHARESVGRAVGLECLDFLGRGRNAQEVERGPADQGPPIGRGRRREPRVFEPGQNKCVNRRTAPGRRS